MLQDNAPFEIPVCLIIFKRAEKTVRIIEQISKIRPSKLYLIGDGPRNQEEAIEVDNCRRMVEESIDWPCEVIKNYAEKNRGVYQNIAGGAFWVFEREDKAIFLEDDNYPALSFFQYCKELLEKYQDDNRVLWICGTNYHGQSKFANGCDYVFTQLMLPCGWASWSNKFTRFYDGLLSSYRNEYVRKNIRFQYHNSLLYKHDYPLWDKIIRDLDNGKNPSSWDYQMAFTLRVNNLVGIAPKFNQITNIGVDIHSIHGGTSINNTMTARFCEVPIFQLEFPLKHPQTLMVDEGFERSTEKIIILPFKYRLKGYLVQFLKKLLRVNQDESIRSIFKRSK